MENYVWLLLFFFYIIVCYLKVTWCSKKMYFEYAEMGGTQAAVKEAR